MQHIYFVRHGTTEWMELKKIQGISDIPLSARGRKEAENTAKAFAEIELDAVYCSPLLRAYETAAIICQSKDLQPQIIPDLRELNFGWMEGRRDFNFPQKKWGIFRYLALLWRVGVVWISGEHLSQVKIRAKNSWRIIDEQSPQGTILIVAHGILLSFLISGLLSPEQRKATRRIYLQPCSISEMVREEDGSVRIVRLNDTSHLK